RLTEWMLDVFGQRGIRIARVYHCPDHPTAGIGAHRRDSFDRKPNPGMLLRAQAELGLDLRRCVFLGDKDSDMAAGRAAGVGHLVKLDAQAEGVRRAADVTVVASLHEASTVLRRLETASNDRRVGAP
ncbi:MAG TPA: HAD-IA family hydrolase, partial [Rubrivivax sp.]|nr:HAD-IA family hydrolase [Rubrivivax sp.]